MRIDKYLWSVRFFKTRSLSTIACKKGQVKLDNAKVKPAKEVFGNEMIFIRKNSINYTIKVLDIPKCRISAKLVYLYSKDITEKQELLKINNNRKKSLGRPTKKERRSIEKYRDDILENL